LANTGFQTVNNHIGLEPKHTVRRYASVIWNGVWWNETNTSNWSNFLHAFASRGFVSISWAFLFTHLLYVPIYASTLDYKFLFNYLQLW